MVARGLIFHMSIPCDKTFPRVLLFFTLEFDPFFETFNLANNFRTVSARVLIFYMSICCDKTFPLVPLFFTMWPRLWSLTHSFKYLNSAYNFCTVSAKALIFHRSICCDKTFLWIPLFFTLWPWRWSLTKLLKLLTLLITFEQWVLELWSFKWVSLVIRLFRGFHYFDLVTLTWKFDLLF